MIYEEYHELKVKYEDARSVFDEILTKKERLFTMTQPRAVNPENEKVLSSNMTNVFDEYLIKMEESGINAMLSEARSILSERESLLKMKEAELRKSPYIQDKVYRMHFIDGLNGYKIARKLYYSKSRIYELIEKIEMRIRVLNGQKRTNEGL